MYPGGGPAATGPSSNRPAGPSPTGRLLPGQFANSPSTIHVMKSTPPHTVKDMTMQTLSDPSIFDMDAQAPDMDRYRAIDIQTWQMFSAQPTKNRPPASLDYLVTAARHAGLFVIDVVALRSGAAIERSAWLFLDFEAACRFLSDVSGVPVDKMHPGSEIDLNSQFVTELFGPSIDAQENHLVVTCELLRPVTTAAYQPSLFDVAA